MAHPGYGSVRGSSGLRVGESVIGGATVVELGSVAGRGYGSIRLPRYGLGARFYDVLSGERSVYRAGRLRGIAALDLRPGARVLDVGCGTGLNLAPLLGRVGPTGRVVGVDRSDKMLAQARARWPDAAG